MRRYLCSAPTSLLRSEGSRPARQIGVIHAEAVSSFRTGPLHGRKGGSWRLRALKPLRQHAERVEAEPSDHTSTYSHFDDEAVQFSQAASRNLSPTFCFKRSLASLTLVPQP
jgi:hypothetical protein